MPHSKRLAKIIIGCILFVSLAVAAFFFLHPTSTPPREYIGTVALTFDDGPSEYTLPILDALKKNNAKATFCVVGKNVEKNPNIAKKIVALGNEICGHSYDHEKYLTEYTHDELATELVLVNDIIREHTGVSNLQIKFHRPPWANYFNNIVPAVSEELGMAILDYDLDSEDWKYDADHVYNYIMENVADGKIILAHDVYQSTVDAYKRIIPDLTKAGYKITTAGELLGDVQPGSIYPDWKYTAWKEGR